MDSSARGVKSRLKMDDLPELASLAQTGEVMGLTGSQVRRLIRDRRLAHVLVGCRSFVPKIAILRFIAENTVQPCHEETYASGEGHLAEMGYSVKS
jgi:hypothetical protein